MSASAALLKGPPQAKVTSKKSKGKGKAKQAEDVNLDESSQDLPEDADLFHRASSGGLGTTIGDGADDLRHELFRLVAKFGAESLSSISSRSRHSAMHSDPDVKVFMSNIEKENVELTDGILQGMIAQEAYRRLIGTARLIENKVSTAVIHPKLCKKLNKSDNGTILVQRNRTTFGLW